MNDRTDDEDDPVAEDEVVINEESDVTELAEKRRRRAPEKYSPTWFMDSDVIAFMREVESMIHPHPLRSPDRVPVGQKLARLCKNKKIQATTLLHLR